jgi:ribosomal protein S18 acetylase RimI-like enzyme
VVFCDLALAARIERAERDLVAAIGANVAARVGDVLAMPIGGGLAAFSEPGSPMNKVTGLGFEPFDERAWEAVERAHDARAAPIQVELSTLAEAAIGRFLTARGYRLVGVENVLGRALTAATAAVPPRAGIDIAESGRAEIEAWLDVTVTGFGTPDVEGVPSHEQFDRAVLERVIRDFASAKGFVRFTARRDGQVAGAASMRMAGGIAQLCGATTLPAHRRRGVQTALLEHRLALAQRAGCTIAVITTQPGSKSQQNAQKQGFALLYARNVLRREAP